MRIAFDEQVFLQQEYGGISRYICSLAKELSIIPDNAVRIFAPLHFNSHLEHVSHDLVCGRRAFRIPKTFRLVQSLSEGIARFGINRFHPDILHETYYSADAYAPAKARRVITVYDMINELYASSFSGSHLMTAVKKKAVSRADRVICISESTRRDLIELFQVPENKISVVYLGFDELASSGCETHCSYTRPSEAPYLLYVGKRGGYKNFKTVLHAFANTSSIRKIFSLVCFGGGEFSKEEREDIARLGLSSDLVIHINATGDDVLSHMYKNAAAFVYPSLYEGFGIPPLEAMSLDCPVICSNTSSIPEVVGTAGEYFDPTSSESIGAAIESVVLSPSKRDGLVRRGRERCLTFSWRKCANETSQIYRSLM